MTAQPDYAELVEALQAIADGYRATSYGQIISVDNPNFREDNGSARYLVIDPTLIEWLRKENARLSDLNLSLEQVLEGIKSTSLAEITKLRERLAEVEGHARFWEERYREAVRRADEGPVEMPS